jgi:endo-1,4-beta-xylanase
MKRTARQCLALLLLSLPVAFGAAACSPEEGTNTGTGGTPTGTGGTAKATGGTPTGTGGGTSGASCGVPTSFKWSSTGPIISPMSGFAGIKDPSVVFFNNLWHVWASSTDANGGYTIVYLNFSDWAQASSAKQTDLGKTSLGGGAAPQVFYFAPQNKWYMVFEWSDVYSTNTDPSNPSGWTARKTFYATEPSIVTQNKGNGGMIDFWVICDDTNCFLFFSDDNGHLYRAKTPIGSFPNGFGTPVIVMSDPSPGRLFEACNVYRMRGTGQYLLLIEAFDSNSGGKRYFRSWTAPTLDGNWTPLQAEFATPFASTRNVAFSGTAWTQDISHGEMIRSGYDQKLEIDPCHLQYLYQGLGPTTATDYNLLPWKLGLLAQTK